ncbi:MAG: hypothetical protein GY736_10180 [Sphingomonas sp.]|uniref:hypothetical protein n=1 Tax=Sphingomonas sp. TaxID=28214 RepID=UPI00258A6EA1|nr:hypothetical protein [Sphingomonas sp.]MCP4026656.1 hypothetical protein [Sphingomonas sp.]
MHRIWVSHLLIAIGRGFVAAAQADRDQNRDHDRRGQEQEHYHDGRHDHRNHGRHHKQHGRGLRLVERRGGPMPFGIAGMSPAALHID